MTKSMLLIDFQTVLDTLLRGGFMSLILSLLLFSQVGTGYSAVPYPDTDQPCLSVNAVGKASISAKASEYTLILYADVFSEQEEDARKSAEEMREEIIKVTKSAGGKADDVVLTNINTLEPIEDDPYYRIEQDIQVSLKNVKDINKAKEKYLLIDGVQIGSVTPVIGEVSDYAPAIAQARTSAVKNAKEEARALASEVGVVLGEPLYITEQILYPTYTGYETAEDADITVSVTIYYSITLKK
jgi:uncharacterized protein YggE